MGGDLQPGGSPRVEAEPVRGADGESSDSAGMAMQPGGLQIGEIAEGRRHLHQLALLDLHHRLWLDLEHELAGISGVGLLQDDVRLGREQLHDLWVQDDAGPATEGVHRRLAPAQPVEARRGGGGDSDPAR